MIEKDVFVERYGGIFEHSPFVAERGYQRLASDQAALPVTVHAGGSSLNVTPDASGRWSVMLRPSDVADQIQVCAARFDWPGEGGGGSRLMVSRAGAGWLVAWTGPGGAPQSTWLPDGPSGFTDG